jgi:PAS domain S-box-containing protein
MWRGAGVALLLVGVVAAGRRVAHAAAAGSLTFRAPLAFVVAGVWLILAGVSLAPTRRRSQPNIELLGLAALSLCAFELVTALGPGSAIGLGRSTLATAAHIFKFAGFCLLGAWIYAAARASIRTRFVAVFGVLLLAVVLTLSTALTAVISDNIGESQLSNVRNQLDVTEENLDAEVDDLLAQTGQIASLPDLPSRLTDSTDPQALTRLLRRLEFFSVDFIGLLDPDGSLLSSSTRGPRIKNSVGNARDARLTRSDVLSLLGSPVIDNLLDGSRGAGSIDVMPSHGIPLLLAGAPVRTSTGELLGHIVTARYLDLTHLEGIAESLRPVEASVVVGRNVFASTLPAGAAFETLLPPKVRDEVRVGGAAEAKHTIADSTYFSAFTALEDARGAPLDAALVLSAPSDVVVGTRNAVFRVLFLLAIGVGGVVLALAWVTGRRVTRPIGRLTDAAASVRAGDLTVAAPVTGQDEVGRLGATFNEMTASLLRMTDDLKRSAREEQGLRLRIETIIQSMADGLVAVDVEGHVLAFNAEAEVMTGRLADEVIGEPVEQCLLVFDSQGRRVRLPVHDVDEGSTGNVFLQRSGREAIPVVVTSALLRDGTGEAVGSVAIVRDMTREREIERMKSEFLSNMSHELRAPLTPIKGYAQLLAGREMEGAKARSFGQGILESTSKLERIIGLLVDFAAFEAGRLSPATRPVDTALLLERLSGEWERKAPGHEFALELEADLPPVAGDERMLRRSLEELIDNAVKFSPEGGVVRLGARFFNGEPTRTGGSIQLTVTDEGIGIERDHVAAAFSDFRQLDGSETRSFGGLGLGLPFVRRIVDAHNGTVTVDSERDRGTRMVVTLPVPSDWSNDDDGD